MRTFCGLQGREWVTTVIVTVLLAGCGGSPPPAPPLPELVPVSGTVTMGDEPVADAIVSFLPEGASGEGFGAIGGTDSEGHYELATMYEGKPNPGIPVGKYRVFISRMVAPDGSTLPPDPETPPAMSAGRESIPLPFSSPGQTPLRADVPPGGGDGIDFKLKSR